MRRATPRTAACLAAALLLTSSIGACGTDGAGSVADDFCHGQADGTRCDDGNPCTDGDLCGDGVCLGRTLDDGASCDDGDLCTVDGICAAGVCGVTPVDCTDLDEGCVVGACDSATGDCRSEDRDEGAACDDGAACTAGDVCLAGECAGEPVDCSDPTQPCLEGTCSEDVGGCEMAEAADGTSCDDGDPCTVDASCEAGECAGIPVDCSSLDAPCMDGVCNQAAGTCVQVQKGNGESCADANACTEGETCQGGLCGGGVLKFDGETCDDGDPCTLETTCLGGACVGIEVDCSSAGGPCFVGACSQDNGGCVIVPVDNGSSCEDGDPCTADDVCTQGECVGEPACFCADQADGTTCDDGDLCTSQDACLDGLCVGELLDCSELSGGCLVASCDPATGACTSQLAAQGSPCDDEDPCTELDACFGELCVGQVVDCSLLDAGCQVGVCEAGTGACTFASVADGTVCDDGDVCTNQDRCQDGVCAGAINLCGACLGIAPDEPCDDGDACTIGDTCKLFGLVTVCVADPVDCSDLDGACTQGICEADDGACVSVDKAEGTPCSDGLPCTVDDACAGGACGGDNVCGSCVGLGPDAPCDDLDPCTTGDSCVLSDGVLSCAGGAVDCSGLDTACQFGACDQASGGCVALDLADLTPCDDLDPCTTGDDCDAGVCAGETNLCGACIGLAPGAPCDDGDPCTTDGACTAQAGLLTCTVVPVDCTHLDGECTFGTCDPDAQGCVSKERADLTPCEDDDPCTSGDACAAGVCVGPTNLCGQCLGLSEGAGCDDGDPCTVEDACSTSGDVLECKGTALDCSDLDATCAFGACDAVAGGCLAVPLADLTPCDDDDPCTGGDDCDAGECAGEQNLCGACFGLSEGEGCEDGDLCTTGDTCELGAGDVLTCVGEASDCSVLDEACLFGVCDPETGACGATAKADQTPCDDDQACTGADRCLASVCTGDNLCGACLGLDEGAGCDDGDPCTEADACAGDGELLACIGTPVDCTNFDAGCTFGLCEVATGNCVEAALADTTPCDDGDSCTADEACSAGQCVSDDNLCGSCLGLTAGASCTDENACTTGDQCVQGGDLLTCVGVAIDCAASDGPCTFGICDPSDGACVANPVADDTTCDDGDPCTAGDACAAGSCASEDNLCGACLGLVPGAGCDDTDPCTVNDTCLDNGEGLLSCEGVVLDCSGLDGPCAFGACHTEAGVCEAVPLADGTLCEDADACSAGDSCDAGACVAPVNLCGSCLGLGVGDACDDGDVCTGAGTCAASGDLLVCEAQDVDCTSLDGPCVAGTCDPQTGACEAIPVLDGTPCDDLDACSISSACSTGECVGAPIPLCGAEIVTCEDATPNDELADAHPLALEDGATTHLAWIDPAGEVDWYSVELEQGQLLTVEIGPHCASELDTLLGLYREPSTVLASDDDGGQGNFSRIADFEVDETGTWYIGLTAFHEDGVATYLLHVDAVLPVPCAGDADCSCDQLACVLDGPDAGLCLPTTPTEDEPNDTKDQPSTVAIDEQRLGRIDTVGDLDWYGVPLDAGVPVIIETLPFCDEVVDPDLHVFEADGVTLIAQADSGGEGPHARVEFTPATTGTYLLQVSSPIELLGAYVLDVRDLLCSPGSGCECADQVCSEAPETAGTCVPANAAAETLDAVPLAVGERMHSSIDVPYDDDVFELTLDAGTYTLRTLAYCDETTDTAMTLRTPGGEVLASDDDGGPDTLSLIGPLALDGGTYELEVGPSGAGVGQYIVLVE